MLHHLALGARCPESQARFYSQTFGLDEQTRHFDDSGALRSVWLARGGTVLMIEKSEFEAPRVNTMGRGPFLLAFPPPPGKSAMAFLAELGIAVESTSEYSVYFRDLEDNRVAFSNWPERIGE